MIKPNARFRILISLLLPATLLALAACNSSDGGATGGNGPVTQQGDNLDGIPADNTMTCADGALVQTNATFPQPTWQTGNPSCTILTFFPGAQPTTPGTVVSANIRVGAVTGPMRFVRMRILVQNILVAAPNFVDQDRACCSVEQYGPVFTPTPNTVTTVDLNFPMVADHIPPREDMTTIAAGDLVGLEILTGNVPIPGHWVNNGGAVVTLPNYLWFPAMSARFPNAPTQNLRSEASHSGFMPSYNLNFRAAAKTTSNPGAFGLTGS